MINVTNVQAEEIPIKSIFIESDFNCRGNIAPYDVEDLVISINELGLLSPIIVEPVGDRYRIVAGHRRFVAFKKIGKEKIPAKVVTGLNELQAREINLVENIKRRDLNLLQESRAMEPFIDAGWPDDKIAERLGVSDGWVYIRKCVLGFDPQLQEVVSAGILTQEQIKELHTMNNSEKYEAVRLIKESKEKHQKVPKLKKKETNFLAKKPLTREEIFKLQEVVYDAIGANFATRSFAIAAGEISHIEWYRDLKDEADRLGIDYTIPKEIREVIE